MNMDVEKSSAQIETDIIRTRAEMGGTLDAIQRKLSPGQLLEEALDRLGTGSSEFMSNLGRTVRENPVPVTLAGLGLGWLAFSAGRKRYRPEIESGIGAHEPGAEQRYRPPLAGETEAGQARLSSSAEGGSAGRKKETAKHAVHELRDTAGKATEALHARSRGLAEGIRERVGEARDRTEQFGERARYRAVQVRRGFLQTLNDRPLVLGAVGVAVGAAIGAALPSTRREDELVGETRDRLKEKAVQTGKERLADAERIASTAARAAKDEAEQQGLTLEEGKRQVEKLESKVGQVASAARKAAADEAGAGTPKPHRRPSR